MPFNAGVGMRSGGKGRIHGRIFCRANISTILNPSYFEALTETKGRLTHVGEQEFLLLWFDNLPHAILAKAG